MTAARPATGRLVRDHDVSGVSGTGTVAEVCVWPDGTAAIRWLGDYPTTVHHDRGRESIDHINSHGGYTRIVWDNPWYTPPDLRVVQGHVEDALQGEVERWDDGPMREALWTVLGHVQPLVAEVAALRQQLAEADQRAALLRRQVEEATTEHDAAGLPPTGDRADLVTAAAQAIRDANASPEATSWWQRHPQLIPAHVYAEAVIDLCDHRAKQTGPLQDRIDAVNAALRRAGIEHPLGAAGVDDLAQQRDGAQEELDDADGGPSTPEELTRLRSSIAEVRRLADAAHVATHATELDRVAGGVRTIPATWDLDPVAVRAALDAVPPPEADR